MERNRWAEAEAAFDEAVAARPLDTAILLERARFLTAHSQGQKADDDFARAYILGNREPALLDTIYSSESLFRRVVAESADSATTRRTRISLEEILSRSAGSRLPRM